MIVSRFTSFTEKFVIGCNQLTKICTKYDSTSASSARNPCNLGSKQMSQFRSGKWVECCVSLEPLLLAAPKEIREKNWNTLQLISFASNNVFVGVRVSAQPYLQMCSRSSCPNQLSNRYHRLSVCFGAWSWHMVLRACQLSYETCSKPTQRDAVPMPSTEISEKIHTQFSHARVPDRPVPYLSPVAPCVRLLHWIRVILSAKAWHVICSAFAQATTLSLTAATKARMEGSPSLWMITRTWPIPTTHVSFGPFCVQRVAKKLVEDRHEANKAMTGSSPASVKYPVVTFNDREYWVQHVTSLIPVRCFTTPSLHTRFAPSRCREMRQLMECYLLWCRTLGLLHRFCQWCILSHGLWSHISHILSDGSRVSQNDFRDSTQTVWSRTHYGQPSLADTRDMLHRCQHERFFCWCQSRPSDTTDLGFVSVVEQIHPPFSALPLVFETSLGDHWRPIPPPSRSGGAHPQLQTSLLLELWLAELASGCRSVHLIPELVHLSCAMWLRTPRNRSLCSNQLVVLLVPTS